MEEYELVVVVSVIGHQYVGKLQNKDSDTLVLRDHLKYMEHVNGEKVNLAVAPPSHNFVLSDIELKWVHIEKVTDQKFISVYESALTSTRAARAGIVTASQVPKSNSHQQVSLR